MKKYIIRTPIVCMALLIFGCSDEYFDVNTPSGATISEQLSMNDLLGPAIFHSIEAQYWAERSFGNYTQYFTTEGGGAEGATAIPSTWTSIYRRALPSLNTILEKAEQTNSNHFSGIAKTLTAANLGLAADSYGNIPYSEAAQGQENLKPAFDSQEAIYTTINRLLNEAISELSSENNSLFSPGSGDIAYDGDIGKWLRAAHTLKARYALHLSEIDVATAANLALESLENGFESNADDLEIFYDERNINPWHSRQVLAPNTGNPHDKIADQLVSYMNGTFYPFTSGLEIDPRLPVYADNDGEDPAEPYRGYETGGATLSSDGEAANTNFANEGFYSKLDSPIGIISYAEALFIKAEAAFLANGGTTTSVGSNSEAYMAYLAGIQANMDKLEVDGTQYLAEDAIAVGETGLMLNHIMKEKYIANFLNPETFVDFRRYDFSDDVFLGLTLSLENEDSQFPGEWLVRAQYPDSEETRNPVNVQENKQSPIVPVWWDR